MKRIIRIVFLSIVLFGLSWKTSLAQANPPEAVGPELAWFDRGNQEAVNANVIVPNNFTGTVQVINMIGEPEPFNPSPGAKVFLRLAEIKPTTSTEQMRAFAEKLNASTAFPPGTVVIVGNEMNNLTLEFPLAGAIQNDPGSLRQAAQVYARLYMAFANRLDRSKYQVAPAPPDLYNGDWDPVPWVDAFVGSISCGAIDTLVANVFDVPSRVGLGNLDTYQYLTQKICGKPVTHFGGWGSHPDLSIKEQVEFLNNTPLPAGIATAATLIVDNCEGRQGNQTRTGWMYYIRGRVFRTDGTEVDPDNCAASKPFEFRIVPCNAVQDPEFHSLRPYPASPCIDQIEDVTYMCANNFITKQTFRVTPADAFECVPRDDGGQTCKYKINSAVTATVRLPGAELPIMGNTELVPNSVGFNNPGMPFVQRVNEYVSWYLNGVTFRAEEGDEPIGTRAEIAATVEKIINLSGPLKKLLPWDVQNRGSAEAPGLRQVQKQLALYADVRHNQIAVCVEEELGKYPKMCYDGADRTAYRLRQVAETGPFSGSFNGTHKLFSYAPFSNTEDRLGRSFINVAPQQPNIGGVTTTIVGGEDAVIAPDTSNDRFDDNLYFAHMEESVDLSRALQNTFRPYDEPGYNFVHPPIEEILARADARPYCEIVDNRTNPGDDLYAELDVQPDGTLKPTDSFPISKTVEYVAEFSCDFSPAGEEQFNQCVQACLDGGGTTEWCNSEGAGCRNGSTECEKAAYIDFPIGIDTPRVEEIWQRLVDGPMGVFKRMFPLVGPNTPITEIKEIPGKTTGSYVATNAGGTTQVVSTDSIAGDPFVAKSGSSADIYFPHIGGVYDYFLKGIQKALRPRGIDTKSIYGDEPICSIENSGIGSQKLRNMMAQAAAWANVPIDVLITVARIEGRCRNQTFPLESLCGMTDQQVDQYSAPNAHVPWNCPDTPGGSKGPFQMYEDSVNWDPWKNAVNTATGESRTPHICNLKDSLYAAAYRLSASRANSAYCPQAGYDVARTPAASSWTEEDKKWVLTRWAGGCNATFCGQSGGPGEGVASTYCNFFDLYKIQFRSDCDQ